MVAEACGISDGGGRVTRTAGKNRPLFPASALLADIQNLVGTKAGKYGDTGQHRLDDEVSELVEDSTPCISSWNRLLRNRALGADSELELSPYIRIPGRPPAAAVRCCLAGLSEVQRAPAAVAGEALSDPQGFGVWGFRVWGLGLRV